jgi:hypothetical protein
MILGDRAAAIIKTTALSNPPLSRIATGELSGQPGFSADSFIVTRFVESLWQKWH